MNDLERERAQRGAADQIIGYLRQQGEGDAAEAVEQYRDKWVGE